MSMVDPYPPRPQPHSNFRLLALTGILLMLTAWYFGYFTSHRAGVDANAVPRAVLARGDLAEEEKSNIAVFKQASPAVVHITTLANRQDGFSLNVQQIPQGTGSGFVWDQEGHIVTNFHVIREADAAQVTLADHSNWQARLVGAYPDKDLAVLVVDAPKAQLHPIPIGTSSDLQVGQRVYAIGNPFGLDQSLTTGIISALGREVESPTNRTIKDMIQTDAAINPGNSGGPLLDSAGRLIGVNTAIYSPSGTFSGVGFAIPVDEVNRIVPQLLRGGKVVRPGLGVQVASDKLASELGGVLILRVQPGSAAEKAGLQGTQRTSNGRVILGDVILGIQGQRVQSVKELFAAMGQFQVGDQVKVTIRRNNQEQDVTVTLGNIE